MRIIFRKSTGKSFLNIPKAQQRSIVYKSTAVYDDYMAMSMGKLDKKTALTQNRQEKQAKATSKHQQEASADTGLLSFKEFFFCSSKIVSGQITCSSWSSNSHTLMEGPHR